MLRFGAVKRVDSALQFELEPGESLQASVLGYVMGKGDFAIGLTDRRLLWVGVTKLTGKANGKV